MANSEPIPDVDAVRNALREVIDPEAGMNIVDLGLVYRIEVAADALIVEMTMTSPACPMGEMITAEVEAILEDVLPDTLRPDVRLVWSPAWDPSLMSEEARQHFGW
jgi:metal-sulfur cluster biosynthetic enzyme